MKIFLIKKLTEELRKITIRNLVKGKFTFYINDILGADLADMQLISKFYKEFRFLLCLTDIYSKYPWVIAFQKFIKESNHKPHKILVDKDFEFFNRPIKSWLEKK